MFRLANRRRLQFWNVYLTGELMTSPTYRPCKAGSTWPSRWTCSAGALGWRQSSSMHTEFVLDAPERALYDRKRV